MKKLYIIVSSWGNHSDHYKVNELVCSSLFFAENKKTELENKYREEIPFPFDWCTKEEFEKLDREGKTIPDDVLKYCDWYDKVERREVFNCCIINEIDYYYE